MGGVNLGRVVLGGLLAGLVIDASEYLLNVVVLGAQMEAAMQRLNLPPVGGIAVGVFTVLGFVLGIMTIWVYAAIRRGSVPARGQLSAPGLRSGFSPTCTRALACGCWGSFRRGRSRSGSPGVWRNFWWLPWPVRGSTRRHQRRYQYGPNGPRAPAESRSSEAGAGSGARRRHPGKRPSYETPGSPVCAHAAVST